MITISKKDQRDLQEALALRIEVFGEEQGVDHDAINDQFDQVSHHFLVHLDGEVVGTARWRSTESGNKIERVAVSKAMRGKHIGAMLLKTLIEDIQQHSQDKVYLYAQAQSKDFYLKAGFEMEGDPFVLEGIEHVKMVFVP